MANDNEVYCLTMQARALHFEKTKDWKHADYYWQEAAYYTADEKLKEFCKNKRKQIVYKRRRQQFTVVSNAA